MWRPIYSDWKWLTLGSLFAFFFASILLSGWPAGLIPNIHYPYIYGADGTFSSWEVQRLIEGWIFDNPRNGYPFGSNFLDYGHSDNGNLFILKLLSFFVGTYYGSLNLYLLLGFPVVFIISFLVLKTFGLRPVYAFSAALLFSFTPFHFWRLLGHVFYTWYFVVPLYIYYAWKIFSGDHSIRPNSIKKCLVLTAVFVILSSFGIYYAFFGVICFLVSGLAAVIKDGKLRSGIPALFLSILIGFGLGLNLSPTFFHLYKYNRNTEVAQRLAQETEFFSLKPALLFFPQSMHRIKSFRKGVYGYANHFVANETTFSSSLGFLPCLGFILLIFVFFAIIVGKPVDPRLSFFSLLIFSFLLIATPGSLNLIFALLISPLIRGWNRISIFISFAAVAALFLVIQNHKKMEEFQKNKKWFSPLIPLSLMFFGILDQTPSSLTSTTNKAKKEFILDQNFIHQIEASLPPHAAIFQLPYFKFPEQGNIVNLNDYALAVGFLNSKTLRWSYGGVRGRKGDLFYQNLDKLPIEKQIETLQDLGFAGIYVACAGFYDQGRAISQNLTRFLGPPSFIREDGLVLFYRLPSKRLDITDSLKKI